MKWCDIQITHFCKLKSFKSGCYQPKTLLLVLTTLSALMSLCGWAKKKEKSPHLSLFQHMTKRMLQFTAVVASFTKIITTQHKFTMRYKNILITFSKVITKSRTIMHYQFNYFFINMPCHALGCHHFQTCWVTCCLSQPKNNIRINPFVV